MVNRQAVEDFLAENGCQDTEGAMAPLERLFQIADSGRYLLTASEEIDQKALMEAVVLATGKSVSKVLLISLSDYSSKPEWMTREAYEVSVKNSIGIGSDLWSVLSELFAFKSPPSGTKLSVSGNLAVSLANNLENSLKASLNTVSWSSIQSCLWSGLSFSLMFYLDYCLANNKKQISKLKPLLEFWDQCLIIGFKKNDSWTQPGTLLVFCR